MVISKKDYWNALSLKKKSLGCGCFKALAAAVAEWEDKHWAAESKESIRRQI